MEVLDNGSFGFRSGALGVRIFDPQHKRAALPAREKPVEERGPRIADVKVACGAGSEAYAHKVSRGLTPPRYKSDRVDGDRFAGTD